MSVEPNTAEPYRYLHVVKEPPSSYVAGEERRPTLGEAGVGFTQVDNAAILDTKLSLAARMLYVILRQHRNGGSGKCCPAYSRLSELLGTSEKPAARTTVARALKELLDAGLVAWERHGGVNFYTFRGDDGFDATAEVAHGYFSSRSSARLLPKYPHATSEVAHGYSNNMKLTTRIEQHDSAPTERGARAAKPAPEKSATTPKEPTPTVEANPVVATNVPRKRAGADATQAGYELMAWWCERTDNILHADERRRFALGADDLLRKAGGDRAEAEAYIDWRIGKGGCNLQYVARDYLPTWRNGTSPAKGSWGKDAQRTAHEQQQAMLLRIARGEQTI